MSDLVFASDMADYWRDRAKAAEAEIARLRNALAEQAHEIDQILGKALGYPTLPPDWNAGEDVCTGDHVPESLAMEAADTIARLRGELERVKAAARDALDEVRGWPHGPAAPLKREPYDAALAALDAASREGEG